MYLAFLVFWYISLHNITLHFITLHYILLHYITLHFITLHYITFYYITLHFITLSLHYILLHYHYITSHHITDLGGCASFFFGKIYVVESKWNLCSLVGGGSLANLALGEVYCILAEAQFKRIFTLQ